jgi:hypothetical protein
VIVVKYDDIPMETGLTRTLEESTDTLTLTLWESVDNLIADQPTGNFSTEGGTVFKTAYIAEGSVHL